MAAILGFAPGNRPVFSTQWASNMRNRTVAALQRLDGLELVVPGPDVTEHGLVKDQADARRVTDVFTQRGVTHVLLGTMNFGDEESLREIGRRLHERGAAVMLFGTPDDVTAEGERIQSDSFCGTLSVADNLHAAGVPFAFAGVLAPEDQRFGSAVRRFIAETPMDVERAFLEGYAAPYPPPHVDVPGDVIERAVAGFRNARLGQFGPRPPGFLTCAYDERLLLREFGQNVAPVDLATIIGRAKALPAQDPRVQAALKRIHEQMVVEVPEHTPRRMAALYVALRGLIDELELAAVAHNCWTALQTEYGVSGCAVFAMLEDDGTPIACETDVYGAVSMLLQKSVAQASGDDTPPHFQDWTIAHPTRANVYQSWHCGKAALRLYREKPRLRPHDILKPLCGADAANGTLEGELRRGPVTMVRVAEFGGEFRCLVTGGEAIEGEWPQMRGSWNWIQVGDLERLYRILVEKGFSHHVSVIHGDFRAPTAAVAAALGMEVVWV